MFYLIHSAFAALIILIILLYFLSTKKSKLWTFKKIFPLISMILVIITAWCTVIMNMEMREESSRKPDLKLVAHKVIYKNDEVDIWSIMVINEGNIEATVIAVYIVIPEKSNIKINSFDIFSYYKTEKGKEFYVYDRAFDWDSEIVTSNGGSVLINTAGGFAVSKKIKQLEYEIAYTSRYDSGLKKGFFEIK